MRKIFLAFNLSPDFFQGIMSTASEKWSCIAFSLLGNGRFSLGMPLLSPADIPVLPNLKQEGQQNRTHWERRAGKQSPPHTGCWVCPGMAQDISWGYREEQKPWRLAASVTVLLTPYPLSPNCSNDSVFPKFIFTRYVRCEGKTK